ncbi:MAG: hypothetical protein KatS3mg029_0354 [Saprospiraceae bacterium]|nr:MAG: hypothetical protein KatS3mg029_0354 [Saprospiraceae bacterium]
MRKIAIAVLLIAALTGLTLVQFRLLMTGVTLEKQRFDQRIEEVLQRAVVALDDDETLSMELGRWLAKADIQAPEQLTNRLDSLLNEHLAAAGIRSPRIQWAVTDLSARRIYLRHPKTLPEDFHFGRYAIRLGPAVTNACLAQSPAVERTCFRALHLDVANLFAYLLGRLRTLIVLSLVCLVVILSCLGWLIHYLRREERLNEIKNDFINNLTHELKTPVFSISLAANMAAERLQGGQSQEVLRFLETIRGENEKLKTHIDKVLELANLQRGRYELDKQRVNVRELTAEVVGEYAGVLIDVDRIAFATGGGSLHILADPTHFKNVLRNLLDNAIKYGGPNVHIEVGCRQEGEFVRVSVRDTGPGIPPEHLSKVFEKFYRVPRPAHAQVKGFGLGLSYVKQIVEAHGGKVSLSSEMGRGTTVNVWWLVARGS